MKRVVTLLFLFTIVLGSYAPAAHAQFWKKWFNKEKPRSVRRKAKSADKETTIAKPPKKKKDTDFPASRLRERYRIDVFAPLFLDQLMKKGKPSFKGKIPEKAVTGIDFYEGVKLAADTLNSMGYNIDVYIHDVADSTEAPPLLIGKTMLDSSDLIIGLLPSAQLPDIANFAEQHHINFISALTPTDGGIKNNPYFILQQPSLESHCERISQAISKKYHRNPILLYRTSVKADETAYRELKKELVNAKNINCTSMPKKAELASLLDSDETNVIAVSIVDHVYAEKLLIQLSKWFPQYNFDIYGMPTWKSIRSLKKPDAYPNLAIYISAPFYFDISTAPGQALAGMYKQDAGNGLPSEMVFRGYETMFLYAHLLHKYGTIFNEKLTDVTDAPFTRYEITRVRDNKENLLYYQNKHICLYRYQSSSYIVEQ